MAITSPAAGPVSGIVLLEVTASDDRRVTAVSFRVNGSAVIAVDSVTPFSYSWDADSYAIGAYVWQATASDKAGNTTSSVGVQYNVVP